MLPSPKSPAPVAICSIATTSHESLAVLALRRFGTSLPDARLVLLRVDRAAVREPQGNATMTAEDCVPRPQLAAMRKRYSRVELCFALKPFLIARLLADGHEQVHYVDADCHAYRGLEPLVEDLRAADLLLTSHCLSPIPDDGRTPTALTVLRAGAFNAGYLGVRATRQGHEFAQWLCSMTECQAYNRPAEGMCGDQRWLDLAPSLFPGLAMCRHRGANVAYWNLHERPLARDDQGCVSAGGEPLLFFHFSGFDPSRPEQLSRHQNRHALIAGEPLHGLVQDYLTHLRSTGLLVARSRTRRCRQAIEGLLKPRSAIPDDEQQ